MSKQIIIFHRAIKHAEEILKDTPGIRYCDFVDAIAQKANCSDNVAKNAVTALRRSGNAVSTNKYSEGYTWSDDGTPQERLMPLERISRVQKNANECKAPLVNPEMWTSLMRVMA